MTDNCESRRSLAKWLCRLGNALEDQEDGTYLLKIVGADEDGNLPVTLGTALSSVTDSVTTVNDPEKTINTVIDDATFNATVESADINLTEYRHIGLTLSIGAKTGTPTITVSIEAKDSNGNYITYYTLPTLSTGSEEQSEVLYDVPFSTVRVVATLASTTSFANVTLEATLMK